MWFAAGLVIGSLTLGVGIRAVNEGFIKEIRSLRDDLRSLEKRIRIAAEEEESS